ncbi:MAG: carbon-nitrogen family hydrolase [Planctomycetes bacterium]|nr:carbon-nitrogen family hydrolase [Planctomycetota bacterium]
MAKESHPRRVRSACVQFDVRRGEVEQNLAAVESLLREAAAGGARIAVLPEMWTCSFVPERDDAVLRASSRAEVRLLELSAELGLMVVGSAPHVDAGQVFNRAQLIDAGRVLGEYRKIHLFSPIGEHRCHVAGCDPLVVDTRFGRVAVAICYDIRFPELVRYYFHRQADILLVPAQWPEARSDHWRCLVKARAIENQLFVVGCNRIGVEASNRGDEQLVFPGDSRVVDPMGAVIASGAGEAAPIFADLELRRVRMMRRILPIAKDRRPEVYVRIWKNVW